MIVTDALVHESHVMDKLIHSEEQVIYGDKAFTSEKKRQDYGARGLKWYVNRKACRNHQLTTEDVA